MTTYSKDNTTKALRTFFVITFMNSDRALRFLVARRCVSRIRIIVEDPNVMISS